MCVCTYTAHTQANTCNIPGASSSIVPSLDTRRLHNFVLSLSREEVNSILILKVLINKYLTITHLCHFGISSGVKTCLLNEIVPHGARKINPKYATINT